MARLGLAAIILEGPRCNGTPKILTIDKSGARLEKDQFLKGAGNYEISARLRERFSPQVGVIYIGPAGEFLMIAVSVASNDRDGFPCRHAARAGWGACGDC
jgi:aldehyde:ferredoxin oxidoreductase